MRSIFILNETIDYRVSTAMLLVLFHVTEITGKVLLDRNPMYSPIVHRIHGYWYCLLFLLLFTVYTITIY